MLALTPELLSSVAAPSADRANIVSVIMGLQQFGADAGLDQPHRFVQYIAQLAHESGGFKYDKELWGPTDAQKRYDVRTDLGNTPERDGDGELYKGRTGMQLTGKRNYEKFYEWAKAKGYNPPDFVKNPELVNTDPWEGLVPIWYWDVATGKSLNVYADQGDNEMITRKINGGLNGYQDRLDKYTKLGVSLLGYSDTLAGLKAFQTAAKAKGFYNREIDGLDGPGTRAAIHQWLVREGTIPMAETKPAPVTENVPVAPKGGESTLITRVFGTGGLFSVIVGFFADVSPEIKVALAFGAMVAIIIIIWKAELIAGRIKSALSAFGLRN